MSYKAIGFDYGGVINGSLGSEFRHKMCKLLDISEGRYSEVYFKHNKKVNRGEVSWQHLWEIILSELGKSEKIKEVMELSNAQKEERINEQVLELVGRLKENGYKTGLLSNNSKENAQIMRDRGVDGHFNVFHVSAETGFVKPEPEAFEHFVKKLGVDISELIYIDDTEKSLSTSDEVGFTPILFKSYKQLITKLSQLGVKFE